LTTQDEQFMRSALAEAEKAGRLGEVPVGAVVVVGGSILGRAGNRREGAADPTAHAEVLAIREAAKAIGGWRLVEGTIYVTQEPCPMCAGAIVNARLFRLVYGCANLKAGAVRTLYQILEDVRLNHRVLVESGVLAETCGALLTHFFDSLRMNRRVKAGGPGPWVHDEEASASRSADTK
jgi:tRNA(adenine34) deaminase